MELSGQSKRNCVTVRLRAGRDEEEIQYHRKQVVSHGVSEHNISVSGTLHRLRIVFSDLGGYWQYVPSEIIVGESFLTCGTYQSDTVASQKIRNCSWEVFPNVGHFKVKKNIYATLQPIRVEYYQKITMPVTKRSSKERSAVSHVKKIAWGNQKWLDYFWLLYLGLRITD